MKIVVSVNVSLNYVSFLFSGFTTMSNLQKRLISAAFRVLLQAMFMNEARGAASSKISVP